MINLFRGESIDPAYRWCLNFDPTTHQWSLDLVGDGKLSPVHGFVIGSSFAVVIENFVRGNGMAANSATVASNRLTIRKLEGDGVRVVIEDLNGNDHACSVTTPFEQLQLINALLSFSKTEDFTASAASTIFGLEARMRELVRVGYWSGVVVNPFSGEYGFGISVKTQKSDYNIYVGWDAFLGKYTVMGPCVYSTGVTMPPYGGPHPSTNVARMLLSSLR